MKIEKKRVMVESREKKTPAEAAAFLREIADRIEKQEIVFNQGEKKSKIKLPATFLFKFSAKEKPALNDIKYVISLDLKWTEGDLNHSGLKLE